MSLPWRGLPEITARYMAFQSWWNRVEEPMTPIRDAFMTGWRMRAEWAAQGEDAAEDDEE